MGINGTKRDLENSAEARRLHREARALEIVKAMRPTAGADEPAEFFYVPSEREEALQELLDAPSHIYFIYSAGRVKIGFSTRWRGRVDEVCQGCGHESELILVMPGDRKAEQDYHTLFHESRETGEWFRLDGNVRRFLDMYASEEGKEVLNLAHQGFLEEA